MNFEDLPSTKYCIEKIRNSMPKECVIDQLAEEAAELSQAANKLSRVLRGVNPTPTTYNQAIRNLVEEYSDVILVAHYILDLDPDGRIIYDKLGRWKDRLEEKDR